METYIITYELNSDNKKSFELAISSIASDYCELHANAWLFSSSKSENEIRDTFLSSFSKNDRFFFCKASKPYDCYIESKAVDYIKFKKLL